MNKWATFSAGRLYRYELWRTWDKRTGYAMFICLNPSTADEMQDDPTVRRCIAFAKGWGYGGLCVTNLFAFRATSPQDMKRAENPIGPNNDVTLQKCAREAAIVIAGWGTHGGYLNRSRAVQEMMPVLYYLRMTKGGEPAHPLYLPKTLTPQLYAKKGK